MCVVHLAGVLAEGMEDEWCERVVSLGDEDSDMLPGRSSSMHGAWEASISGHEHIAGVGVGGSAACNSEMRGGGLPDSSAEAQHDPLIDERGVAVAGTPVPLVHMGGWERVNAGCEPWERVSAHEARVNGGGSEPLLSRRRTLSDSGGQCLGDDGGGTSRQGSLRPRDDWEVL